MKPTLAGPAAALALCCAAALAAPGDRTADTIFVNGRIVTLDAKSSLRKSMAVKDGRIVALSESAAAPDLNGWQGRNTRIVDLKGRTVIPGLIDSHIHAIRAALSFSTEVNWIGAKSLDEALGRMRSAAKAAQPGEWLIVAGPTTPYTCSSSTAGRSSRRKGLRRSASPRTRTSRRAGSSSAIPRGGPRAA